MKVLLLEDVRGLGKKGEVCEVKDGYGKNFLIANNKAKHATNEVINRYKAEQRNLAEKQALEMVERKQLAKSLEDIVVVLVRKGNNGALFGSITKDEIAQELESSHHLSVDKKLIEIKSPIKNAGDFVVLVKLGNGVNADLKVQVKVQ